MELNITQEMKHVLSLFLLILLPLLLLAIGVITGITYGLYFILSIIWFAVGLIFFSSVN